MVPRFTTTFFTDLYSSPDGSPAPALSFSKPSFTSPFCATKASTLTSPTDPEWPGPSGRAAAVRRRPIKQHTLTSAFRHAKKTLQYKDGAPDQPVGLPWSEIHILQTRCTARNCVRSKQGRRAGLINQKLLLVPLCRHKGRHSCRFSAFIHQVTYLQQWQAGPMARSTNSLLASQQSPSFRGRPSTPDGVVLHKHPRTPNHRF